MKILLTLFVLLFSSSVVAAEWRNYDNLSGKQIFCIDNLDKANYIGFEFLKNQQVNFIYSIYADSNEHVAKKLDIIPGEYKTNTSKIFITFDNKKFKMNTTYKIDRRNLRLTNIGNLKYSEDDIVIIEKDICEVVEHKDLYQYIKKTYEKQILIIKSKNKI